MITEQIKNNARMKDEDLFQRLRTLERFGVVGFEKRGQFDYCSSFLTDQGVDFESNDRLMIWTPNLAENVKKILRR